MNRFGLLRRTPYENQKQLLMLNTIFDALINVIEVSLCIFIWNELPVKKKKICLFVSPLVKDTSRQFYNQWERSANILSLAEGQDLNSFPADLCLTLPPIPFPTPPSKNTRISQGGNKNSYFILISFVFLFPNYCMSLS